MKVRNLGIGCKITKECMDIPSKGLKNTSNGNCTLKMESKKNRNEFLSNLTGFPVDYIKKELVLDDEEVTLEQLREHMMVFLNSNFESSFPISILSANAF